MTFLAPTRRKSQRGSDSDDSATRRMLQQVPPTARTTLPRPRRAHVAEHSPRPVTANPVSPGGSKVVTKLRLLSATHRTGHGTPPHHLHKLYSPGHTICSSKPKPVNAACGAMHPVPPYTYNMFDVCTQCGFVVIRGSSWEHRCGEEHSTSAPPNS